MTTQIDKQIGQYFLVEKIGSGSTATVFRATKADSEMQFAVKVLSETLCENEVARSRFQREIEMLQKLAHPAIIPIVDFGEVNGRLYIVMPFMSSGNLRSKALEQPLSLAESAAILSKIAPAIDTAHQQKIIHRDIKPQNILLDAEGNPYLSDFGVARLLHPETKGKTMTLIGTPEFMAPEQVMQGRLTAQSDIYQLGVTLYFMLTRQYPFRGSAMEVMSQQVRSAVPSVRRLRPDLSVSVDMIIAKATSKLPRLRYQTAADLLADLELVVAGGDLLPPLPPTAEWTTGPDVEKLAPTIPPEAVLAQPADQAVVAAPSLPPRRKKRRIATFASVGIIGTLLIGFFALFAPQLDGGGPGQPNGIVENTVEVVDDAVDEVLDVVEEVTAVNQPAVIEPAVEIVQETLAPIVELPAADDAPEPTNNQPPAPNENGDGNGNGDGNRDGNGNGNGDGDRNGDGNGNGNGGGNGNGNGRPPRGGGNGGG